MIFYKSLLLLLQIIIKFLPFPLPSPPPLAKFSIYRHTTEQNIIMLIYKSYLNLQNIVQAHKHSLYIVVTWLSLRDIIIPNHVCSHRVHTEAKYIIRIGRDSVAYRAKIFSISQAITIRITFRDRGLRKISRWVNALE